MLMMHEQDHKNNGDGGGATVITRSEDIVQIIEVTQEQYAKVQKLRKLKKSGVLADAVRARCQVEQIDSAWIFDDSINVILASTANAIPKPSKTNDLSNKTSSVEEYEEIFRVKVNDDGESGMDFLDPRSPLSLFVKIFIATVQRRGQLDIKTGGGTYLSVNLIDLKNAYGSFRSLQYDRDMFLSTTLTMSNDVHEKKTSIDSTDSDDDIRSKRYRFHQHLISVGMSRIQPTQVTKDIIPGLNELIRYLDSAIVYPMRCIHEQENESTVLYTFEDLGYLFQPGVKCLARNAVTTAVDFFVQVVWSRYEQGRTLGGIVKRFIVTFELVCSICNGQFSTTQFTEHMLDFEKKRSVDALPFQPVTTLPITVAEALLGQARALASIYQRVSVGSTFMGYKKGGFFPKGIASAANHATASRSDGRVMVDIAGSYEAGHSVSKGYDGIVLAIQEKTKEIIAHTRQQQNRRPRSESIDRSSNPSGASSITSSSLIDDGPLLLTSIPFHLLELTWPVVTGFSFTAKAWGEVLVDRLYDIEFKEETFDRLVLPASQKRMIKALVRHSSDSFQDIVAGKGEGSVFLLYGPPGVGKTLTAEAISEILHRPLYSVSLGQLGTTPSELEKKMGEILELCSRWDALILLDEADIFLEKRTTGGSLERNAMVSVMLRLVEYFKGVLFLTSNRVDSLDPAFRTRITLALRYEALDAAAREQVWKNILEASGQGDLVMVRPVDDIRNNSTSTGSKEMQQEHLKQSQPQHTMIQTNVLASYPLNGREIKNCIRLALALAAEDGTRITQEALLETILLMCDFNEKLNTADAY